MNNTVSPSQLRSFTTCPKLWELSYQFDISKPVSKKHFDLGNYFHEHFHGIYQLLKANPKTTNEFLKNMVMAKCREDLVKLDQIEIIAKVLPKLLQYIDQQMPLIDRGIEVLEVEYEFHAPVTTPLGKEIDLHGIIDLVYRDLAGNIRIRDHKTGEQARFHTANSVKLNDQLLFYAVALNELGFAVKDVEISFTNSHVYKNKQPPVGEIFQLHRYQHNTFGLEFARNNFLDQIDAMYNNKVIRNYSPNCGNCVMFDICTLEMRGQDTTNLIKQNYEVGNRAKISKEGALDNENASNSFTDF